MFYFLALNSGLVFAGNYISVLCFAFNSSNTYRSMHGTLDNLFDSRQRQLFWKYSLLDIILLQHLRSSLNVCEKTFGKSRNKKPIPVTGYIDMSLPEITGQELVP